MGNYQSLRVLSQTKMQNNMMSDDAITEVANMINTSGKNRAQRRKLTRDLGKIENILAHTQEHVDRSSYKEYEERVNKNFTHFFAILALTLKEDYRWKEDDNNDQISSMLERVGKKINKYANMGYETDDLVKLVEDEIGLILIPEK